MTKSLFRVSLRGENFPGSILGESGAIGFYTTRFVEAASECEAELAAIEMLRADPTLDVPERLRTEDAMVFADEVVPVPDGTPRGPNKGFAFFPMEGGDGNEGEP